MADEMTDKDRVEAYSKLSEQLYKQYSERRELEWKIHVAIWTFLAAVGYLLVTQRVRPNYSIFGLLLIVPLHAIWCMKIHIGEFRDQRHSIAYRQAAERLIVRREKTETQNEKTLIDYEKPVLMPPQKVGDFFASYWWWVGVEAGTTALITIAVILLAWQTNAVANCGK